jgi:predicted CXXCH cytochrome family protein
MLKIIMIFIVTIAISLAYDANYVGDTSCIDCHKDEHRAWKGSHHDLAMQVASEKTVLADFNNTQFNYNGIITKFYKKDGKYMVLADGPDGKMHEYEIDYTFGVYPLQQYMIKFPDGKVQVLDPTWDARSKEEGGQRWYHIHPDENVTAGDPLHWTGPNMNWNYMCADCHSTNLKKNYEVETKTYHTTWSSINVSCEACHGPASKHLEWTKNQEHNLTHKGFPISFKSDDSKPWREKDATLKHFLQEKELNTCAKCHSRRTQMDDNFVPGGKFHEHYLPVNLADGLYFEDGKIDDEVYVYNSFLQSKMYEEGVTCTDCHDPHSLQRKAAGDKVCFSCHQSDVYTDTSHHKHSKGSTGSSCIACHMPARTYMGVDSRNDHSFRVPRPDISVEMPHIPNACNLCHNDQNASWATDAMRTWYGKIPKGHQNFAHDMKALRDHAKEAPKGLYEILMSDASNVVKVTATEYLGNYPSRQTHMTTLQMLRNSDPMVRRAALQSLESFPVQLRIQETFKALSDSAKLVRMEAARQLASYPLEQLDSTKKQQLLNAFKEYEKVLLFTAERPESQLSLAMYYSARGETNAAQKAFDEALLLQDKFVPAYINYSNFLRSQGKEQEALEMLLKGLQAVPDIGILHHAIGLWYVRNKQKEKAIEYLKEALILEPNDARFAYVYAVAIGEKEPKEAIKILKRAYEKHTGDKEIVSALVYYYKQVNEGKMSKVYEEKLKVLENFSVR